MKKFFNKVIKYLNEYEFNYLFYIIYEKNYVFVNLYSILIILD